MCSSPVIVYFVFARPQSLVRHIRNQSIPSRSKTQSGNTDSSPVLFFLFQQFRKRQFVPRDRVFPLLVVYSLIHLHRNK